MYDRDKVGQIRHQRFNYLRPHQICKRRYALCMPTFFYSKVVLNLCPSSFHSAAIDCGITRFSVLQLVFNSNTPGQSIRNTLAIDMGKCGLSSFSPKKKSYPQIAKIPISGDTLAMISILCLPRVGYSVSSLYKRRKTSEKDGLIRQSSRSIGEGQITCDLNLRNPVFA